MSDADGILWRYVFVSMLCVRICDCGCVDAMFVVVSMLRLCLCRCYVWGCVDAMFGCVAAICYICADAMFVVV
eukprot:m.521 g.521  ORF g.521 m.521 type:complete len:73 (-) comp232_c0_seq1:70-288(-)